MCVTNCHDMTLAVKVALNPNTNNQPPLFSEVMNHLDFKNSLPNNKILNLSKLKAFADNIINMTENLKFVWGTVENIVGKGENAGYQHFLLFPQVFQKASFSISSKVRIVW